MIILTPAYIKKFRRELLRWHLDVDRNMPWKETNDPYKIWLSEIILQQTRVAQGTPYYQAFIDHYPTVDLLAEAEEDEVLKLWQGLGYYSRARNLHFTAKKIVSEFNGIFPTDYKDILSLKGIGPYTAAAIASFAYGDKYAVVDGNVTRVLSRVLGITDPIDVTKHRKKIEHYAQELIDEDDPAGYNQAIMDLGATICTPKNPECKACPFSEWCVAKKDHLTHLIPIKQKKIKRRQITMHYMVMTDDDHVIMEKRDNKSIWKGLYQPILMNSWEGKDIDESHVTSYLDECKHSVEIRDIAISEGYKHILTHLDIEAYFYKVRVEKLIKHDAGKIYSIEELKTLPLPKLIENYMKNEDFY